VPSRVSRFSNDSRDKQVEQVAYINGKMHRMAALRSKSASTGGNGSAGSRSRSISKPKAMHSI
jgi:hypothetical protein